MIGKPETGEIRLYTIPEVAGILRVKRGYAYELVYTGRLKAFRLSERRIRVSSEQLKRYLEQEMKSQAEN